MPTLRSASSSTAVHRCQSCGHPLDPSASVCLECGHLRPLAPAAIRPVSERRILPAFLLCALLGMFGAHRFYAGRIGTGILQILTVGGLGLWWLADLILLVTGHFKDAEGARITEWT